MRRRSGSALAYAAVLAACGSDGPTDPSAGPDSVGISLEFASFTYPVSDQVQASLLVWEGSGPGRPTRSRIEWSTADPTIVSVSGLGRLTMLANGSTMLRAATDEGADSVRITVAGTLHRHDVSNSETWSLAGSPHVVTRLLEIGAFDTTVVTIEPGAVVRFRPSAGLEFGRPGPGRLVIPAGSGTVTMQGDSAAVGTWTALTFFGPTRSELRDVEFRHCGRPSHPGAVQGCVNAQVGDGGGLEGPTVLFQGVTILEAPHTGFTMGGFTRFAPGSRDVTVKGNAGFVASIYPTLAGSFPLGGQFTGNAPNEIEIGGGLVSESMTLSETGLPWRLTGSVIVDGPTLPVLTIPAGHRIRATSVASISAGVADGGSLVVGSSSGQPVVMESTGDGWFGLTLSDRTAPSSLTNTVLRDCGLWDWCVTMHGGLGSGTTLRVEDVSIEDSRGGGIRFTALARFAEGSSGLTVRGATTVPLEIRSSQVGTIPAGTYSGNTIDVIRLPGSSIVESATWSHHGVPYALPDGLEVGTFDHDVVLTLDAGVELRMGAGTSVIVADNGRSAALRALGTPSMPVRFTSDAATIAGAWEGIWLRSIDDRTRFAYAEIAYAGSGDGNLAGAVRMSVDPGGLFTHTTVRNSATCGLILFGAADWTDDYTDPALSNQFLETQGPPTCRAPA